MALSCRRQRGKPKWGPDEKVKRRKGEEGKPSFYKTRNFGSEKTEATLDVSSGHERRGPPTKRLHQDLKKQKTGKKISRRNHESLGRSGKKNKSCNHLCENKVAHEKSVGSPNPKGGSEKPRSKTEEKTDGKSSNRSSRGRASYLGQGGRRGARETLANAPGGANTWGKGISYLEQCRISFY